MLQPAGMVCFGVVGSWGDQAPNYFSKAWWSMRAHVATFHSAPAGEGARRDDGDAGNVDADSNARSVVIANTSTSKAPRGSNHTRTPKPPTQGNKRSKIPRIVIPTAREGGG